MDRLPHEILRDIFLKALPINVLTKPEPAISSVRTPLYISHVSRFWREISLSCGKLWSHLYLRFISEDKPAKRKADVEVFYTWLSRTNGLPINFWIILKDYGIPCEPGSDNEQRLITERVIATLFSQQRRWKDVVISWAGISPSSGFPGIKATDMPLLSSLRLSYITLGSPIHPFGRVDISRSPRLKGLHLQGQFKLECGNEPIDSLKGPSSLIFKWIGASGVHQAIDFLKIAPNLEGFVADVDDVPSDDVPRHVHNEHERLVHDLRGLSVTCRHTIRFIDRVTLPRLQLLHLRVMRSRDEVGGLFYFIQRSLPPLTLLELDAERIGEAVLVPVLGFLPSLLHLRIRNINFKHILFHALTVTKNGRRVSEINDEPLCPRLESFLLQPRLLVEHDGRWYQSLATMAKSRCKALGTFRRMVLRIGKETPLVELDVQDLRRNNFPEKGYLYFLHIHGDETPPFPFGSWTDRT